jgi:hypothetical protein
VLFIFIFELSQPQSTKASPQQTIVTIAIHSHRQPASVTSVNQRLAIESSVIRDISVGEGEVTPNEAQVVSSVIEVYRKVIETTELESRIIELEKVSNE